MNWIDQLAEVDDDYLIGLSNKGIVKRAYKDKEEAAAQIGEIGAEAVVKVGGETVTVCFPLGESKCTCPSRSMCRHVVHAVLALKEYCAKEGGGAGEEPEKAEPGLGGDAAGEAELGQSEGAAGEAKSVQGEIAAYPLASLKKILGGRQLINFVNLVKAGLEPEITSSSIVTVRLPKQEFQEEIVVKLLSPLEYSACTCHRKELCAHKAAAILWCQLQNGVLKREELEAKLLAGETGEGTGFDMERVKDAAEQMRAFLEELFCTGLSRTSPEVMDSLDRFAVISHNVGLARFEGYFRALSDSYDRYFKRKAVFKTQDLAGQLTRLYRRTKLLLKAREPGEVYRQAGEFRAEYLPVGNLDLIGISMEHFVSQAGYEGDTVYFLEENTRRWYTYTYARPVFYEPGRKRGAMEKSLAPWGLNLALEDLVKVRIRLEGAKCDERGRLSASQDTRGEIKGEKRLELSDIQDWYYEDFGKLYREQIDKPEKWLREQNGSGIRLVYVRPDSLARSEFSHTGQLLTLPLYDKAGRELLLEVEYSKRESGTIRYLERITEKDTPCFLGKLFLRDGRMRMYPVDAWKGFPD